MRIITLVLPQTHLLDLAGPVQVFAEANDQGAMFDLRYCGPETAVSSAEGLAFAHIEPLSEVIPTAEDIVIVPGYPYRYCSREVLDRYGPTLPNWLHAAQENQAKLCSVCTGAFVFGYAGLLDGRACTTHWQRTAQLQEAYPQANVLADRLFVTDGRLYTSAGIASGIDLALALLEEEKGPIFTAKVARHLVIYMRRDGSQKQQSIHTAYRDHLAAAVHDVQDWLIAHPDRPYTLETLADMTHMSSRHLTRQFKKATGVTIKHYATLVKQEQAKKLLQNPNLTVDEVARQCGFQNGRQLRRLWQNSFGKTPRQT